MSSAQPQQQPNLPSAVPSPNSGAISPLKKREPLLGVAVGKKGVGKTHQTNILIWKYVTGNLRAGTPPRKVLVLDVNDEMGHLKAIDLKHILHFSASNIIEARRVRIFKPDGSKMSLNEIAGALQVILDNFKEGLLLIEDINKYVSDNLPADLIGSICTQRHTGCDIIMHFQGIGRIVPKIWQNLNWLRFHRNLEGVDRHCDKFPDKEEPLKILECLVTLQNRKIKNPPEKAPEPYFAYYNADTEKIQGAFSQLDFYEALELYLENNYNKIVKKELNKFDIKSRSFKKIDPQQAVNKVLSELFLQYYGNGDPLPMTA